MTRNVITVAADDLAAEAETLLPTASTASLCWRRPPHGIFTVRDALRAYGDPAACAALTADQGFFRTRPGGGPTRCLPRAGRSRAPSVTCTDGPILAPARSV
jgi:hypothetical protein